MSTPPQAPPRPRTGAKAKAPRVRAEVEAEVAAGEGGPAPLRAKRARKPSLKSVEARESWEELNAASDDDWGGWGGFVGGES
jgi:hypothetical protein